MASILPFIGWSFLPNYATSFLQSVYYGITIRAGDPRPMPQTPRFERDRRRIFVLVIISYLFYTLYETFHQVQVAGDYYKVLGVSPFADERTIKSRFRKVAAQFHPDKVGLDMGAEAQFIFLRRAQETLADPVKRFAYDRFGPDMLDWGEQKTMRDFVTASLSRSIIPQYIGGFATMIVLNWLWWANWGRYWRFFTFAALLTLELALITHPQAVFMPTSYLPDIIRAWIPEEKSFYLLPFQILTLARRASITLHIFISQMAPPSARASKNGESLSPQTMQRMGQLVQTVRATDFEATRLMQLGLAPFRGDRESVSALRRGMKEGLILGGVRSSPEVQQAVAQVLERRKGEKEDKVD
ncbi:Chaperone protein DnaJ [Penicillium rolfsii]|nr:Chaperone protein DnaJ [Penicillium rolfsii]